MSECRIDPVTGITVVIEPERAGRPRDFLRTPDEVADASTCPFCLGHEEMTPPSRLELAIPGEGHWEVRAFANSYPALVADPDVDGPSDIHAPWPYEGTSGFGSHEVIVETPRHDETLADYTPEHAALLADAIAYACERAGVRAPLEPVEHLCDALASGSLLACAASVHALRLGPGRALITDVSTAASCAVVLERSAA